MKKPDITKILLIANIIGFFALIASATILQTVKADDLQRLSFTTVSHHFIKPDLKEEGLQEYNSENYGIAYESIDDTQWLKTTGVYKNSYSRTSVFIAAGRIYNHAFGFKTGYVMGVATGYPAMVHPIYGFFAEYKNARFIVNHKAINISFVFNLGGS